MLYATRGARWIVGLLMGVLGGPLAGCGAEAETGREAAYPVAADSEVAPPPAPAPGHGVGQGQDRGATPEGAGAGTELGVGPEIAIGEPAADEYVDTDPAALTDFREALEPYGTWREDPVYGTVWTPSPSEVGEDFKPYVTAGHWVYDGEYIWVSDYPWGWAPFHYGRWVYVSGYGWSWIPGRVYAGAWVTWRYGYHDWAYVGWAPLPPTWGWFGGIAIGLSVWPRPPYVFCGSRYLFHPAVGGYIVTGAQVPVVAARTRPYVVAGPAPGSPGYTPARPSVAGPPPEVLRIPAHEVAHASAADQTKLARARQFGRPSTAAAMGARPPQRVARSTPAAPAAPRAFRPDNAPYHDGSSRPGRPTYVPPAARAPYAGTPSTGVAPSRPPAASPPTFAGPPRAAPAPGPRYVPPPSDRPPPVRAPSFGAAPRYSPPPTRAPSATAPRFTPAPSPTPRGPSVRAPSAPRPSAPAVRAPSPRPAPMARPPTMSRGRR